MKLVLDEKLKHRLIGLAVIVSLGAIFAPALMKKSSKNPDGHFSVNVTLPAKPIAPDVAMTDEKDLFKTIKVARVDIPTVSEENQLPQLAKAQSIQAVKSLVANEPSMVKIPSASPSKAVTLALKKSAQISTKKVIQLAAVAPKKQVVVLALKKKPLHQIIKAKPRPPVRQALRKDIYAVQLASFSQLSNAQALVSRLHNKGYKASLSKSPGRQGTVYKVYAGHSPSRPDVIKLKSHLASAMQLNGFIVNTGVS